MSPVAEWIRSVPLKDIITIGAASVGAVLGVMNTWNSISQRRLRVRVTPAFILTTGGHPLGFSIEIIKLSIFPITIVEVGFDVGRGKRMPIQTTHFSDQRPLPRRLEPREAISAMFGPSDFNVGNGIRLGDAYARTACGHIVYGRSPAGRELSKMLAEIANGR